MMLLFRISVQLQGVFNLIILIGWFTLSVHQKPATRSLDLRYWSWFPRSSV